MPVLRWNWSNIPTWRFGQSLVIANAGKMDHEN